MAKNNKTVDRIQVVWNILGGEEGVDRLIQGEVKISEPQHAWHEKNGVIYFSVTSDNESGEGWTPRLEAKGFRMSDYAKSVLCSSDFKPTDGVTYEIAVLKGMLFSDNDRVTKKIRAAAYAGKFTNGQRLFDPNAEVACLIREKFTDEEIKKMGLWWIVAMHEPIKDSDGDPRLLGAYRHDDGWWLDAFYVGLDFRWHREYGFVFTFSQVGS